jgi:Tfp pilus assembly protein PilF
MTTFKKNPLRASHLRIFLCTAVVTAYFLSAGPFHAAEKKFTEVRSENFRVITDGSDGQARRIAREFEEMRAVMALGFPKMRLSTGAPLLIFAVQDEASMRALAPALFSDKQLKVSGLFQHHWEKQFAIVRLDQDQPGAHQVVYHEYVHSLLHTNFRWLPTWLDEGLAEFYGGTRFDGKKAYVGAPIPQSEILKKRNGIPLETLLKVNPHAYFRGKQDDIGEFYAKSWALVHFLIFGPEMDRGKKLSNFYAILQQGDPQVKAFRETFGELKDIENGLDTYINSFAFQSWVIEAPGSMKEKDFAARKLSKAEADAEIAGYRLWNHDQEEAAPLVEEALNADPNLAAAHEVKGFIEFGEGRDSQAVTEFSRAFELDKTRYLSQFFAAIMTAHRETSEGRDELRASLLQTTQINPQFAPAYVQLAMLELADGNEAKAFAMSRKAESLEPSRASYHLLSGKILLRMKKEKEAAEYARFVAERWEGIDHNEAVALWNLIPEASRPAGVAFSERVQPQSKSMEGTLKTVKCEGGHKDVVLDRGDAQFSFRSKGAQTIGYSETLWYGADHFNFCHHTEGMHAVVRYRPPVGNEYEGDWLSIELRDELPPQRDNKPAKDAAAKSE